MKQLNFNKKFLKFAKMQKNVKIFIYKAIFSFFMFTISWIIPDMYMCYKLKNGLGMTNVHKRQKATSCEVMTRSINNAWLAS